MSDERHDQISALFLRVMELPPKDRRPFLDKVCDGDDELLSEVSALMAAGSDTFLEGGSAQGAIDDELAGAFATAGETQDLPSEIGGFPIHRILGRGGMGVVYLAQQENPRREVALKVMHSGAISELGRRRFEFEIGVLARLRHDGIARIFEAGQWDSPAGPRPYFVMEHVSGSNLTKAATDRRWAVAERVEALADVCDAIEGAHRQGVIHRDLKPANVLIDEEGRPKVLDFGVAKATDLDDGLTELTQEGQLVGTIAYMSPEQARGEVDQVDTRTDVYALGVILYELLCERLPYGGDRRSAPAVLRAITDDIPPPPSRSLATKDPDLDAIVAMALEKEPARRYSSAAQFAADLRRYLNGDAVQARKPTALYQLTCLARRNRVAFAASCLAVIGLIAATLVSVWFWRQAESDRAIAVTEATRSGQLNTFLTRLLSSANPEFTGGGEVTARQLLDEASASLSADPPDDPRVESSMREVLATSYAALQLLASAAPHYQRLVELQNVLGEHRDQGRLLAMLARGAVGSFDLDGAHNWLNKLTAWIDEDPSSRADYQSHVLLANAQLALIEEDDEELAIAQLEALIQKTSAHDEGPISAAEQRTVSEHLLATAEILSELDLTEQAFQQAMKAQKYGDQAGWPSIVLEARAAALLATIRARRGDPEAAAHARTAIERFTYLLGPNHVVTVGTAVTYSAAVIRQGAIVPEDLRERAEGALEVFDAAPTGTVPNTYWNELGILLGFESHRNDDAAHCFQQVLANYELGRHSSSRRLAEAAAMLGKQQWEQGNFTAAEESCRRALAAGRERSAAHTIARSTLPWTLFDQRRDTEAIEEANETIQAARRYGPTDANRARLLFSAGRLLSLLGQYEVSAPLLREADEVFGNSTGLADYDAAECRFLVARAFQRNKEYDLADQAFQSLADQGPEVSRTLAVDWCGLMAQFAGLHYGQGNFARSLAILEEVRPTCREIVEEHPSKLVQNLLHSGAIHIRQKGFVDAAVLIREASTTAEALPVDHPLRQQAAKNLQYVEAKLNQDDS